MTPAPDPNSFQVAWICPLRHEAAPARAAFSTTYDDDSDTYKDKFSFDLKRDRNTYFFGNIHGLDVVVVCPLERPEGGQTTADEAWRSLSARFDRIKYLFLVGIAGGNPDPDHNPDIRCGDVVIGIPSKPHSGITSLHDGWKKENKTPIETAVLRGPNEELEFHARRVLDRLDNHKSEYAVIFNKMAAELRKNMPEDAKLPPAASWEPPAQADDICFKASYSCESTREKYPSIRDWCPAHCKRRNQRIMGRPERKHGPYKVHGGLIASSNQVIEDAKYRDEQAKAVYFERHCAKILAFEMEGAAIARKTDCLHVRGVCDYADSHKTKAWQGHAAIQAVAVAKIILFDLSRIFKMPQNRTQSLSTNQREEDLNRSRADSETISPKHMANRRTVSLVPTPSFSQKVQSNGRQNGRRNTDVSSTTNRKGSPPYRTISPVETERFPGSPYETEKDEDEAGSSVRDCQLRLRGQGGKEAGKSSQDRELDDEQESLHYWTFRRDSSVITFDDSSSPTSGTSLVASPSRPSFPQASPDGKDKGKRPIRPDPSEDSQLHKPQIPDIASPSLTKHYLASKPLPKCDTWRRCQFRVQVTDVNDSAYQLQTKILKYPGNTSFGIQGSWSIEPFSATSSSNLTGCCSKMLLLQPDSKDHCLRFWVPPDNVFRKESSENGGHDIYEWSDCRAWIPYMKQGRQLAERCYKPRDPNIRLQISFDKAEDARSFQGSMLFPTFDKTLWEPCKSIGCTELEGRRVTLYQPAEAAVHNRQFLVDAMHYGQDFEIHRLFVITKESKILATAEQSSSDSSFEVRSVQNLDCTFGKSDRSNSARQHSIAGRPTTEQWVNGDPKNIPNWGDRHKETTLKVDLLRGAELLAILLGGQRISLDKPSTLSFILKHKATKKVILLHKINDSARLVCLSVEDRQWLSFSIDTSTIHYGEQKLTSNILAWEKSTELSLHRASPLREKSTKIVIKFDDEEVFNTCRSLFRRSSC